MSSMGLKTGLLFSIATLIGLGLSEVRAQANPEPTLTQRLQSEPLPQLIQAIRTEGDPVRGAILFASPKLGCATCHASGSADRIGPDLRWIPTDTTDDSLVQSILEPSRVIRDEYQTTLIETSDGNSIAIRVLEETPQAIRGRAIVQPFAQVVVPVDQILSNERSPVSAMPDSLADQLKDRQEFLHLIRYLMELRDADRSALNAESETQRPKRELDQVTQGRLLLDQFNCRACHDSEAWEVATRTSVTPYSAPQLSHVGSRVDPEYLRQFLSDPSAIKPGTTMPNVMHSLPAEERDQAALELTHYLVSLSHDHQTETDGQSARFVRTSVDADQVQAGQQLFHEVGCVACHAPRDANGTELELLDSVPLGDVGAKYRLGSLIQFLEDPHQARPAGRMPNLRLSHAEATSIAHFLVQGQPNESAAFTLDHALASKGRTRFVELNCQACHAAEKNAEPVRVPVNQLDGGCLSSDADRAPRYSWSLESREQVIAALQSESHSISEPQQVEYAMASLRCYACHQRDGLGGVSIERDSYFVTEDFNLGPQGRIPPDLSHVGDKLNPAWLRQVLVSGRSIRPYLKTRMPVFGVDNVEPLLERLISVDDQPSAEYPGVIDRDATKKVGHELAGNNGLNCIACHTFQLNRAETMSAVDLTEMAERLQRDWFESYLRAPQQLSPNTVMPTFWPGGKSIRPEILEGDVDRQIEAIWVYLEEGRQANTPRGLLQEPLEIVVDAEAVMLRRSYPEVGKRGIGVGYPGGVNLVFDAEMMRLAMIWKGKFVDPAGVWRGQGHGTARPLGRDLLRLANGPELSDLSAPWTPEMGRPAGYSFRGYQLNALRRPTLRYEYQGVLVTDFPQEYRGSNDEVGLDRHVTIQTHERTESLVFRLAQAAKIEQLDDHRFRIDDRWTLEVHCEVPVELIAVGEEKLLRVKLPNEAASVELVLLYRW